MNCTNLLPFRINCDEKRDFSPFSFGFLKQNNYLCTRHSVFSLSRSAMACRQMESWLLDLRGRVDGLRGGIVGLQELADGLRGGIVEMQGLFDELRGEVVGLQRLAEVLRGGFFGISGLGGDGRDAIPSISVRTVFTHNFRSCLRWLWQLWQCCSSP